jgi:hypothetical protein
MNNTQPGEIIDFNAEWLHRRILYHMNANEMEMASYTSALLEGYLEGLWTIPRWNDGEPVFELSKSAQSSLPGLTGPQLGGPLIEH